MDFRKASDSAGRAAASAERASSSTQQQLTPVVALHPGPPEHGEEKKRGSMHQAKTETKKLNNIIKEKNSTGTSRIKNKENRKKKRIELENII